MKIYREIYKPALFLVGLAGVYCNDISLHAAEGANLWAATTTSACPDPCPPSPCSEPCPMTPGPVTPEAAPCVRCPINLGVSADFIYWYVQENDLSFVAKYTNPTTSSTLNLAQSSSVPQYIYPNWKMVPGLKVGVDVVLGYDGWDLFCQYTWLNNSNTKKVVSIDQRSADFPTRGFIFDIYSPDNSVDVIYLSNNWRLNFNVIDLELARSFFISPKLTLRPHMGLKGTWQKQKDTSAIATYLADVYTSETVFFATPLSTTHQNTLKTKGIGMRAGLDANWFFYRSLSLFGNIAGTALWEIFNLHNTDYGFFPNLAPKDRYFVPENINAHLRGVCPVVEAEMGLRFETWFANSGYHLSVEAGWEVQWWHAQNKMGTFGQTLGGVGDLSLQGLTIGARLDF